MNIVCNFFALNKQRLEMSKDSMFCGECAYHISKIVENVECNKKLPTYGS